MFSIFGAFSGCMNFKGISEFYACPNNVTCMAWTKFLIATCSRMKPLCK